MLELGDRSLSGMIRENYQALCAWGAAIAFALIGYFGTAGTQFHQVAVGILLTVVCLFVGMSVVEGVWLVLEKFIDLDRGA
jgi:hypothetical protein